MEARRRTCLSTPVIPPIWIIKSKSVFRIHQSPHCSQITPRCVEDISRTRSSSSSTAAYGCNHTLLYRLKSLKSLVMNNELYNAAVG